MRKASSSGELFAKITFLNAFALRLPVFRNEFEQVAQDAAKEGADY